MKSILALVFVWLCLPSVAQTISNLSGNNVVDGKTVSLSDYKSSHGVIIIFTSNACVFDDYYADRIRKLIQDYNTKIPVLLINPHLGENEAVAAMKSKASERGINTPYLADKDQVIMQQLKATKSPEAVVLQNSGDHFSIFYRGAIDDNAQVQSDVHEHYLISAVDALLAGKKPAASEVRPLGCTIRKK